MKNKDKYKTPEERTKAFEKYCNDDGNVCPICKLSKTRNNGNLCFFVWLEHEAEEEN